MQLTQEQQRAVELFCSEVYSGRRRTLSLGGYAGTGKTTIIKAAVAQCGDPADLVVCTPTGKAAHVLRSKGVEAMTVHSLLYIPKHSRNPDVEVEFDLRDELKEDVRVAIVDEASMLSQRLVDDIHSHVKHVFYVGDHGQLEPVGDDPGIMRRPDIKLERIHRQAAGSPIIQFAHHVRRDEDPDDFDGGGDAVKIQVNGSPDLAHFDVVLCGFNSRRQKINKWIRKQRGFKGRLPQKGETVICLRNEKRYQVWNGMMGEVQHVRTLNSGRMSMDVLTDDGPRNFLPINPEQFGAEKTLPFKSKGPTLWDFGYALTVHKAQGSEWPRVAVFDEVSDRWSEERWRYTAATRASEELRWVLPK